MRDAEIRTLATNPETDARGGNITLEAKTGDILLQDGSVVTAQTRGTGNAGNITLVAGNSIQLDASTINTVAEQAKQGGKISLKASSLIEFVGSSATSTVGGDVNTVAGDITIDPEFVVLNDSRILAQALEGRGGNIRINGDFIIVSADSTIDASSRFGIDGTVLTTDPEIELQKGLVELPEEFIDASSLMQGTCEARRMSGESSFTQRGRGGLPTGADDFPPAFYSIDYQDSGASDDNGAESLPNLSATRGLANLFPVQMMLACGRHN